MISFSNPGYTETSSREWLVTNGIGGFASATICGANTRRYHGLLVAAAHPPTGRQVLVSKVEEVVRLERESAVSLSTNRFGNFIHPEGYQYLQGFEPAPLPAVHFQVGGKNLSKRVFMRYGQNTSIVEYENTGSKRIYLELTPLLVYRDYHGLFRESAYFDFYTDFQVEGRVLVYAHFGAPPLYVRFTKGSFQRGGDWYRAFHYEKEAYRGLDFQEDARSIGRLEVTLEPGERVFLVFSTEAQAMEGDPEVWKQEEINRLSAVVPPDLSDPFLRDLAVSGDQFLVRRAKSDSFTIIAGYPWFTDWGRDTMIAMRGLVIAVGKKEVAKSILRTFLQYLDRGMIPNRFPDYGEEPEYNTIDATLWLFVALYEYYERFEDQDFIRECFSRMKDIIDAHLAGTRYGIQVTEEGLLMGGEGLVQLSWMDAKVGDFVVTPRHGCPVEVNALWYNALEIYRFFHHQLSGGGNPYPGLPEKVAKAFRKYFLNDRGYLNDVVIPGRQVDDSIRPNQIYALSLPFSPLKKSEAGAVLEAVEKHLYTDFGLRSLSPAHPDFKPVYRGNPWDRDTAYHQGTVWAFLWGEYALAYLKYHQFSRKACQAIQEKCARLRSHFYEADGLHAISEIFDGAEPGAGRGCVQQAWSVGMLLRVFLDPNWKV